MKRLRTFLYRLFVKRYLWSLPCKVWFGTKASPNIGQKVALCYRRPSSGGLDGICWKQVI